MDADMDANTNTNTNMDTGTRDMGYDTFQESRAHHCQDTLINKIIIHISKT